MGHSFTHLGLHAIFSTKRRAPMITPEFEARLYEYAGGIVRAERSTLLAAGGMPDHVHFLILMHPSAAPADLMRVVKSRTSGWVHETFPDRGDFMWQRGYAAFAVSKSSIERVRRYIAGQKEHHRTRTFQEELVILLEAHGVAYDPEYLWE